MHEVVVINKRLGRPGDTGILAGVVDPRLALMVRTGLRAAEMAWALELSIDEIEVQLKALSVQLGGGRQAPPIDVHKPDDVVPDTDRPIRPPLVERAISVLGGRVTHFRGNTYLDGRVANFRDLAVAVAAEGVEIYYPGLRPLPSAFHTGPSKAGFRRRTKSVRSLMSTHGPF